MAFEVFVIVAALLAAARCRDGAKTAGRSPRRQSRASHAAALNSHVRPSVEQGGIDEADLLVCVRLVLALLVRRRRRGAAEQTVTFKSGDENGSGLARHAGGQGAVPGA